MTFKAEKGIRRADVRRLFAATCACLACGGSDRIAGPATGPHTAQMEVRYLSALTPAQQQVVAVAVEKWTLALSKNIGDFPLNLAAGTCFDGQPALNETHHNLLLFISVRPIDGLGGSLALTGVCRLSSQDALPILSNIQLDPADLDSMEVRGTLQGVVMHEMAHALGFGPGTYVAKALSGGGVDDPFFSGASARFEFRNHGAWYTGVTVPLENSTGRGPMDPHWRLSVFGDELMVSVVSKGFKSPLSTITLGFFQDIGYDVDFSVADPYEVAPLFGGDRRLPGGSLQNDFIVRTPPTFVSPLAAR
jgi:hypothetical protein